MTSAHYSELLLIYRADTLADETKVQLIVSVVTAINVFAPFCVPGSKVVTRNRLQTYDSNRIVSLNSRVYRN